MEWAKRWCVTFNPTKTESLLISRKINQPVHRPLFIDNQIIKEVSSHKHLGIFLSMTVLGINISITLRKRHGLELT